MSLQNKRKLLLFLLLVVFLVLGILYGMHWLTVGRYQESTDDAYVSGNLVQLMAQTTGNVQAVYADETQWVAAGTPLVLLDGADAQLALDKAKAELAQSVRTVSQLYHTAAAADMLVMQRRVELDRARSDLVRRNSLVDARAVAREDVVHAQAEMASAQVALDAAQQQRDAARAAVANTTLEHHPAVVKAEVALRQAWLAVQRLTIRAPVSGYVAKREVQVGERVTPETPLMVIVPPDQIWLDANFKENQLARIRTGQTVTFTTDLYGSKQIFHGRVAGLGAGTGSVFSLLPAQNATGNWIKVVQRLPVRIALDGAELARHPLHLGLSATAVVDVKNSGGQAPGDAPIAAPAYQTRQLEQNTAPVEQMIAHIVQQNSSRQAAVYSFMSGS